MADYDPSELSNLEPTDPSRELSAAQSLGDASMAAGLGPSGGGFDIRGFLRKIGRGLAWAFGLFIVFLVSAWISLPTRSIAWRISHEARKAGLTISVDDVHVRPWGSATLDEVKWSFKPARPDSTPIPFVVEQLDARFSVLKYLLFGTLDLEFEGHMDEGNITGEYYQSEDEARVKLSVQELPLYGVPKLQDTFNAPVRGIFTLDIDLTAPDAEWAKSSGKVEVHCFSCTIGDGDTKLFVPKANPRGMMAKGVTIPEIDLGTLDGVMEFADGKAVAEDFGTQSDDIVFKISGEIEFKDPIGKSRLNLTIRVFVTPSLRERASELDLVVLSASPKVKMEPPDEGWLAIVLEGNFKRPRPRGINQMTKAERLRKKREDREQRARDRAKQRDDRMKQQEAARARAEEAKAATGDAAAGTDEATGPRPTLGGGSIPPEVGVNEEPAEPEEAAEEEEGGEGEGEEGEGEGEGEEEGGEPEEEEEEAAGEGEGEGEAEVPVIQ